MLDLESLDFPNRILAAAALHHTVSTDITKVTGIYFTARNTNTVYYLCQTYTIVQSIYLAQTKFVWSNILSIAHWEYKAHYWMNCLALSGIKLYKSILLICYTCCFFSSRYCLARFVSMHSVDETIRSCRARTRNCRHQIIWKGLLLTSVDNC